MKRRIHEAMLGIVGLAGLAFFALSGTSCEGPKIQCAVGHGAFAVVYAVTKGDPTCFESANKTYGGACANHDLADDLADCNGLAKIDQVGFATFLGVVGKKESVVTYEVYDEKNDDKDPKTPAANDDADPSKPDLVDDALDDDNNEATPAVNDDADPSKPDIPRKRYTVATATTADYNTRKMAVQSAVLGGIAGGDDPTDKAFAFGDYTNAPDENDLCYAGTAAAPLVAANVDIEGDVHLRQEWSDVRFFVTAGAPGTQVVGKMKFENVTDSCSVEYTFTGLYPSVFCGNPVMGDYDDDGDPMTPAENDIDDDGDPMTPAENDKDDDGDDMTPIEDDDGTAGPDVDADDDVIIAFDADDLNCAAKADPAAGRAFGSGINPDFATYCHPELLHCVL